MGHHINADGEFKSDKYDWCPAGFFALKFTDPIAREAMSLYAVRTTDIELSRDLMSSVMNAEPKENSTFKIERMKDLSAKISETLRLSKLDPPERRFIPDVEMEQLNKLIQEL